MKIYWADREGKSAPENCTFHYLGFKSTSLLSPKGAQGRLKDPEIYKVIKKTFSPDKTQWTRMVHDALSQIQEKKIQKIVLARTCTLELDREVDPFAVTASLKKKSEGAYLFCLKSEDFSFLGATPERLFSRTNRQILSEAVAGTRQRGKTPTEDKILEDELLLSDKDQREILPVQTYIKNTLSPLCQTPPIFTPVSIHKTQNVQHLYSSCKSILRPSITDEEILKTLHPTPALCGTPKQEAFSLIESLEPFNRDLYGGVIGWSTPDDSEWIVAIRSCLIKGNRVTLYSGTGIVEGSNPDKEWDELNHKINIYNEIFI